MASAFKWIEHGKAMRRHILAAFGKESISNTAAAKRAGMARATAQYHIGLMLVSKPPLLRLVGNVKGPHPVPIYTRTGAEVADTLQPVRRAPKKKKAPTNSQRDLRRTERYQRIIDALKVQPMGDQDLADLFGLERSGIGRNTKKMLALRLIHIAGFRQPVYGGNARTLYAPGNLPDAVRVLKRDQRISMAERQQRRRAAILAALEIGGTVNEIALIAHTHHCNARKHIGQLQASKQARVTGWIKGRGKGGWIQVFGVGNEPDVPRPPGESKRSRSPDRVQARKDKLCSAALSDDKKRAAVANTIASAKARPHNIFAALGL